jgi:hypothetical protein
MPATTPRPQPPTFPKSPAYFKAARPQPADRVAAARLARNARRNPPKLGAGPKTYDPAKVA